MKWQTLAILLSVMAVSAGYVTWTEVFSGLDELAGTEVIYHTGDEVCQDCIAKIEVNTTYWEYCFEHLKEGQTIYVPGKYALQKTLVNESIISSTVLYKKSTRGRRLWINLDLIAFTNPDISADVMVNTIKSYATLKHEDYGYLRPIKDGDCLKRYTKANPRTAKMYIIGNPDGELVKWGVSFLSVDPYWIGWKVLYENLSKQVPVYEDKLIEVKPEYSIINNTWSESSFNIDKKLVSYNTEYYDGERIGVIVGGKDYIGEYNVDGQNLIFHTVPTGDRNLEKCPGCKCEWWTSDYEREKGTCTETKLEVSAII